MEIEAIDQQAIIDKFKDEFLADCHERVAEARACVDSLASDAPDGESHLRNLQRHIHSIKGMGGSFGFPSITEIAHALEDFMEASTDIVGNLSGLDAYLDRIKEIADKGTDVGGDECRRIIGLLPKAHHKLQPSSDGKRMNAVRPAREVNVILVMAKGVQRKIIGQELTSCGFGVSFIDRGVSAINLAVSRRPDLIISSMVLEDITGVDLCRAVSVIKTTKDIRFILMTSPGAGYPELANLPPAAAVIEKELAVQAVEIHQYGCGCQDEDRKPALPEGGRIVSRKGRLRWRGKPRLAGR